MMNRATTFCSAFLLLLGLGACTGDTPSNGGGGTPAVDAGVGGADAEIGPEEDPYAQALEEREVDYSAALRIAALRLTGDLPSLVDIKDVAEASDPQSTYNNKISDYIADPRFAETQIGFWQNTFKMGGSPELDSAGIFAAQLVVENRSYLELLTATSGTCATYNGTFNAVDCDNGVLVHAGLLTHPGMQAHFTSNMAFRRTRWVQETFACTAFPTELAEEAISLSETALYTAPWEFASIAGTASGGDIDFLDYSSVVCANCHATMNHLAPLLGFFDENGQATAEIAVSKPIEGTPMTERTDWLPDGEQTAWRLGQNAADLPSLGQVMANDPMIAECAVARAWNWAMGKGDIVDTLSVVPPEVFAAEQAEFINNNYDFKTLLFRVFTSDDFTRF